VAVVVGIDEAGYGPLLGPLVVTGVAFETPDDSVDDCLWERFSGSISRYVKKGERRLPIVDSKKLYHRKDGIGSLERTALVMMGVGGTSGDTFRTLLGAIAPTVISHLSAYPWYREFDTSLPVENTATTIALNINAVDRDLRQSGVQFLGAFCEPLLEGHFNRLVNATRNKAVASMGLAFRIIERIATTCPGHTMRVCVDRQGGRTHYASALKTSFDCRDLHILEEGDTLSVYRFDSSAGRRRFEFVTSGETHELPIALASIVSKYIRELFMLAFNGYWTSKIEGLRPTAGYYQDAQRFLRDIEPAANADRIDRGILVRSR